jgi:hypothetical protein
MFSNEVGEAFEIVEEAKAWYQPVRAAIEYRLSPQLPEFNTTH